MGFHYILNPPRISRDLDSWVKGQIMHFNVNNSPPKPLDVATVQACRSHYVCRGY